MQINNIETSKIVNKPWGRELWLVYENSPYALKILEVNAGARLSMQYHEKKEESALCLSGSGELIAENIETGEMETHAIIVNNYYSIKPGQKHRIIAITDLRLLEVSTPHLEDVVRIEDDSNRPSGHLTHEH